MARQGSSTGSAVGLDDETVVGTVARFNAHKGYGFITPDGAESGRKKDVFVHFSAIRGGKSLEEGQRVEFQIADAPKGPAAINVRVVG